jgi:hypothetical protein
MNNKYFYIKLQDPGYNLKTNPILKNYISNFTPIHMDEKKCCNIKNISDILDKYNKINNIIVLYQHRSVTTLKNNIVKYLNNKNNVKFKFYLFTFDFWHSSSAPHFKPINFKVITFAKNVEQLDIYFKCNHKKWENNLIFKNTWCCYNESILEFNHNPKNKLLISGSRGSCYPERSILDRQSITNKTLIVHKYKFGGNDIISKEFIYNKRLHSYFACFSTSVYPNKINTHAILLKTFEILGSGSLLVMPLKEEKYIGEIGLVNMKNCYLMDFSKDLNPQIKFIFDNIELFNKIRKEGHVHAKNNLNEQKMIEEIKQIIEQ